MFKLSTFSSVVNCTEKNNKPDTTVSTPHWGIIVQNSHKLKKIPYSEIYALLSNKLKTYVFYMNLM